ncbi:uncharacterized protein LOC123524473 [Mercenaria mercenaria]|uniref:uncharacterized protein LOC123524473 n=1 Tax=Mercenaria mercenaria TaxID=6596 RepID=UPI00234ECBFE|nr:uncharacterized protein LOC123524473 [Mercenaria mercenaria]XP_045158624.2 uncharacterized protein LOC123524473 [Mercenaria mercenaria]
MLLKVLTGDLTFKSLTPPDLTCCTRAQLKEYFINSYDLNESLFTALKDDTVFYKCPDRLRLPLIFYYAHTAVVYVNKLVLAGLLKERINFEFEKIFETGVDEMSWDDTENFRMGGSYQWPSVEETVRYRHEVRQVILNIIDTTPLQLPITMESKWWAVLMGMEHERIHLETSSVLIRQLPVDMVRIPDGWTYAPVHSSNGPRENRMLRMGATDVTFGKPENFPSYGWDNEYGEVSCFVPSFEASEYLVTNGEFLEFVKDGGYMKQEYWSEEGWKWKTFRQAKHPMFWICGSGCKSGCGADLATYSHCRLPGNTMATDNGNHTPYKYRAMFDNLDMPLSWPVDVNYHEAKAFCHWKGSEYRLLSEAEHNAIRGKQTSTEAGTLCDLIFSGRKICNHNMAYGSSTPVNMYLPNDCGFYDVFGNVWQWTEDQFNGLCEHTHMLYDDFSSPCYDGKHNVILGGSWISTGDEASRFARYAFRRHFLQHAGFRIARTVHKADKIELSTRIVDTEVYILGSGVEESKLNLDKERVKPIIVPSTNIHYHFESLEKLKGILEQEFGFRKSFPVVIADLCKELVENNRLDKKSALWIGAGSGRGPLLLSDTFEEVLATDVVARFLDTAMDIQKGKDVSFTTDEGRAINATLDRNVKPDKVLFKQFTWIPNEVGISIFDMTVVTFLERTQQPKAWLLRLSEITRNNGLVVIASPSGNWGRERLEPTLTCKGLACVVSKVFQYEDTTGTENASVTVWKHA